MAIISPKKAGHCFCHSEAKDIVRTVWKHAEARNKHACGNIVDNPVECVPMVLFSSIQYDDKGRATYGFFTNRCKVGAVEIPAKTPDGMFEEAFIPNDLGIVSKAMAEYYG